MDVIDVDIVQRLARNLYVLAGQEVQGGAGRWSKVLAALVKRVAADLPACGDEVLDFVQEGCLGRSVNEVESQRLQQIPPQALTSTSFTLRPRHPS